MLEPRAIDFHALGNVDTYQDLELRANLQIPDGGETALPIEVPVQPIALYGLGAPKVVAVTSRHVNGVFSVGEEIDIDVKFSHVVTVHAGVPGSPHEGMPTLQLRTGCNEELCMVKEVQKIHCRADSGEFSLTFDDNITAVVSGSRDYHDTTHNIPWDADPDYVKAKLESLTKINRVSVKFSTGRSACSSTGVVIYVTFDDVNIFGVDGDLPTMRADRYNLGGDGTPLLHVTRSTNLLPTEFTEVTKGRRYANREAKYVGGSGTDQVTFQYLVQVGDDSPDLDAFDTSSLKLNKGKIVYDSTCENQTVVEVLGDTYTMFDRNSTRFSTDNFTNKTYVSSINVCQQNGLVYNKFAECYIHMNDTLWINYTICVGGIDADVTLPVAGEEEDYYTGSASSLSWNNDIAIDVRPPTVLVVNSSTPNGDYGVGQIINISVEFTSPVRVEGSPRLQLETGEIDRYASFDSQPSKAVLQFSYTVLAGDQSADLNYKAVDSLELNYGRIRRDATTPTVDANLTLVGGGLAGSLAASRNIEVKKFAPKVMAVDSAKLDGTYGAGEDIPITLQWDQPVFVTGVPELPLEAGSVDLFPGHVVVETLAVDPVDGKLLKAYRPHVVTFPNVAHGLTNASKGTQFLIGGSTYTLEHINLLNNEVTMREPWAYAGGNVTFNGTMGSSPKLPIMTPHKRLAKYISGSGTNFVTFLYTVERGDYTKAIANSAGVLDVLIAQNPCVNYGVAPDCSNYQPYVQIADLHVATEPINLDWALYGSEYGCVGSDSRAGTYPGIGYSVFGCKGAPGASIMRKSSAPGMHAQLFFTEDASPGCNGTTATGAPCKPLSARRQLVIDDTRPVVTKVYTSKRDGTYGLGAVIDIHVAFSWNISVDRTPVMHLNVPGFDGTGQRAYYSSGSGTQILTFNYTVEQGDFTPANQSLQFAGIHALATNDEANYGYIRRSSTVPTTDAVLDLPPADSNMSLLLHNLVINASAAVITRVGTDTPDGEYGAGQVIDVWVQYSHPVLVTGTPYLVMESGDVDQRAPYRSGSGTDLLTFRYTVLPGDASPMLDYKRGALETDFTLSTYLETDWAGAGGAAADIRTKGSWPDYRASLMLPRPRGTFDYRLFDSLLDTTFDFAAAGLDSMLAVAPSTTTQTGFLESITKSRNIVIDTHAPRVVDIVSTSPNGTYGTGQAILLTVQFDKPVALTGSTALVVDTGALQELEGGTVLSPRDGNNSKELQFLYTVRKGDASSGLSARDNFALECHDVLGINRNTSNPAASPMLASWDGKLYAAWLEDTHVPGVRMPVPQLRVSVFNGDEPSPLWKKVDGDALLGLNYNTSTAAYAPVLVAIPRATDHSASTWSSDGTESGIPGAYNETDSPYQLSAGLYLAWHEAVNMTSTTGLGTNQIRVSKFNGDDLYPEWKRVDGGQNRGINGRGRGNMAATAAHSVHLTEHRGKLWATWFEFNVSAKVNDIVVARYEPKLSGTVLNKAWASHGVRFQGGLHGGALNATAWPSEPRLVEYDDGEFVNHTHVHVRKNLYMAWTEGDNKYGGNTSQLRVAIYNQWDFMPAWGLADGSLKTGVNNDTRVHAYEPEWVVVNGHGVSRFNASLFLLWHEASNGFDRIRVSRLSPTNTFTATTAPAESLTAARWESVDVGGLNTDGAQHARGAHGVSFKGKLYVTWYEEQADGRTRVRVRVLPTAVPAAQTTAAAAAEALLEARAAAEAARLGQPHTAANASAPLSAAEQLHVRSKYQAARAATRVAAEAAGRAKVTESHDAAFVWTDVSPRVPRYAPGAEKPELREAHGRLFLTWTERTGAGEPAQLRVAVYSGDDAQPRWLSVTDTCVRRDSTVPVQPANRQLVGGGQKGSLAYASDIVIDTTPTRVVSVSASASTPNGTYGPTDVAVQTVDVYSAGGLPLRAGGFRLGYGAVVDGRPTARTECISWDATALQLQAAIDLMAGGAQYLGYGDAAGKSGFSCSVTKDDVAFGPALPGGAVGARFFVRMLSPSHAVKFLVNATDGCVPFACGSSKTLAGSAPAVPDATDAACGGTAWPNRDIRAPLTSGVVELTVKMSHPVAVAGTPRIALNVGTINPVSGVAGDVGTVGRSAVYTSGGTRQLIDVGVTGLARPSNGQFSLTYDGVSTGCIDWNAGYGVSPEALMNRLRSIPALQAVGVKHVRAQARGHGFRLEVGFDAGVVLPLVVASAAACVPFAARVQTVDVYTTGEHALTHDGAATPAYGGFKLTYRGASSACIAWDAPAMGSAGARGQGSFQDALQAVVMGVQAHVTLEQTHFARGVRFAVRFTAPALEQDLRPLGVSTDGCTPIKCAGGTHTAGGACAAVVLEVNTDMVAERPHLQELTFVYTPLPGDSTVGAGVQIAGAAEAGNNNPATAGLLDYVSSSALSLGAGGSVLRATLRSRQGHHYGVHSNASMEAAADLTLPAVGSSMDFVHCSHCSLAARSAVVVDGRARPKVLSTRAVRDFCRGCPSTGTWSAGEIFELVVRFDSAVSITDGCWRQSPYGVRQYPQLKLEVGATDFMATYLRGNGTDQLRFTYQVGSDDQTTDLDVHAMSTALTAAIPQCSIMRSPIPELTRGKCGPSHATAARWHEMVVDVDYTLPYKNGSLGRARGEEGTQPAGKVAIDASPPSVRSVYTEWAAGSYAAGEIADIAVEFTSRVSVEGLPSLLLNVTAVPTRFDPAPARFAMFTQAGRRQVVDVGVTAQVQVTGGGFVLSYADAADGGKHYFTRCVQWNNATQLKERLLEIEPVAAIGLASVTAEALGYGHRYTITFQPGAGTRIGQAGVGATGGHGAPGKLSGVLKFASAPLPAALIGCAPMEPFAAKASVQRPATATVIFRYRVKPGDSTNTADIALLHTSSAAKHAAWATTGSFIRAASSASTIDVDFNTSLPVTKKGDAATSSGVKVDDTAPHVLAVTCGSPDGAYGVGLPFPGQVYVNVTFSDKVTVENANADTWFAPPDARNRGPAPWTGSGVTPSVVMATGSAAGSGTAILDREAVFHSGSGTTMLTFVYTVQAGDTSEDLDYRATDSLRVPAGTSIRKTSTVPTTAAVVALPAPGSAGSMAAAAAIVISASTEAAVSGTTSLLPDGEYGAGQVVDVTVTFTKEVRVASGLNVDTGEAAGAPMMVAGKAGNVYMAWAERKRYTGRIAIHVAAAPAGSPIRRVGDSRRQASGFGGGSWLFLDANLTSAGSKNTSRGLNMALSYPNVADPLYNPLGIDACNPVLALDQKTGVLFAAWEEHIGHAVVAMSGEALGPAATATVSSRIRVAAYDGFDGMGMPANQGAAPFNGTWRYIDGNGTDADPTSAKGLNKEGDRAARKPHMQIWDGRLFVTWQEEAGLGPAGAARDQIRVAEFNMQLNDPVWAFVDGGGAGGLNRNTSRHARAPKLQMFDRGAQKTEAAVNFGGEEQKRGWSRLYLAWRENNGQRYSVRVRELNYNFAQAFGVVRSAKPIWTFFDGGKQADGLLGGTPRKRAYPDQNKPWAAADLSVEAPTFAVLQQGTDQARLQLLWAEGAASCLGADDLAEVPDLPCAIVTKDQALRVAQFNGDHIEPGFEYLEGNSSWGLNAVAAHYGAPVHKIAAAGADGGPSQHVPSLHHAHDDGTAPYTDRRAVAAPHEGHYVAPPPAYNASDLSGKTVTLHAGGPSFLGDLIACDFGGLLHVVWTQLEGPSFGVAERSIVRAARFTPAYRSRVTALMVPDSWDLVDMDSFGGIGGAAGSSTNHTAEGETAQTARLQDHVQQRLAAAAEAGSGLTGPWALSGHGLNVDRQQHARRPAIAVRTGDSVVGSSVFVAWTESDGRVPQLHVSQYNSTPGPLGELWSAIAWGTPSLKLRTGGSARYGNWTQAQRNDTDPFFEAPYVGGSGTDTLTFRYTVQPGDMAHDLDLYDKNALRTNHGSIEYVANSDSSADTELSAGGLEADVRSLAFNKQIRIDTTPPAVLRVTSTKPDGAYGAGEIIPIIVSYDKPVVVQGYPTVRIFTGAVDRLEPGCGNQYEHNSDYCRGRYAFYTAGSGTANLTFTYVVTAGAGPTGFKDFQSSQYADGPSQSMHGHNPSTKHTPSESSSSAYGGGKPGGLSHNVAHAMSGAVHAGDYAPDLNYDGAGAMSNHMNGSSILRISTQPTTLAVYKLPAKGEASSLGGSSDISVDTRRPYVNCARFASKAESERGLVDGAVIGVGEEVDLIVSFTHPVVVEFMLGRRTARHNTPAARTLGGAFREAPYPVCSGSNATTKLVTLLGGAGGDPKYCEWSDMLNMSVVNETLYHHDVKANYTQASPTLVPLQMTPPARVSAKPYLVMETGGIDQRAPYVSGSGTGELTFRYTVEEGDFSVPGGFDYIDTWDRRIQDPSNTALRLADGVGVKRLSQRPTTIADLSLARAGRKCSLADSMKVTVNTNRPTVFMVSSRKPDGVYGVGDIVDIQVHFTFPVTVTGIPVLQLATGGAPGLPTTDEDYLNGLQNMVDGEAANPTHSGLPQADAFYAGGSGSAVLTFRYTVLFGHATPRLEYTSSQALRLREFHTTVPGATIRRSSRNPTQNADLTLPHPSAVPKTVVGPFSLMSSGARIGVRTDGFDAIKVTTPLANGTYGAGQEIYIDVHFPGVINVTGVPSLMLELKTPEVPASDTSTVPPTNHPTPAPKDHRYGPGKQPFAIEATLQQQAVYVTGSGTKVVRFGFTVQAGQATAQLKLITPDGVSPGALRLTGGSTITDGKTVYRGTGDGIVAMTMPTPGSAGSLCDQHAIAIDTRAPVVTHLDAKAWDGIGYTGNVVSSGTFGRGHVLFLTVHFNVPVAVVGYPALQLETGVAVADALATYHNGSGTKALTFQYEVGAGQSSWDLQYKSEDALVCVRPAAGVLHNDSHLAASRHSEAAAARWAMQLAEAPADAFGRSSAGLNNDTARAAGHLRMAAQAHPTAEGWANMYAAWHETSQPGGLQKVHVTTQAHAPSELRAPPRSTALWATADHGLLSFAPCDSEAGANGSQCLGGFRANPDGALSRHLNGSARNPHLLALGDRLFAAWTETATFGDGGLAEERVHVAVSRNASQGGGHWRFLTPARGLGSGLAANVVLSGVPASNASLPSPHGSTLFVAWDEGPASQATPRQLRVAAYNGDDAAPVWANIDTGGETSEGLNFDTGRDATRPTMAVWSDQLYVAWQEGDAGTSPVSLVQPSQVRVRRFRFNDTWAPTPASAEAPLLASRANSTRIFTGQLPTGAWRWVDVNEAQMLGDFMQISNATGTNRNVSVPAVEPAMTVANGSLWLAWAEYRASGAPGGAYADGGAWQARVARYNGYDIVKNGMAAWFHADGGSYSAGLNRNASASARRPKLTPLGKRLFVSWEEHEAHHWTRSAGGRTRIRAALYETPFAPGWAVPGSAGAWAPADLPPLPDSGASNVDLVQFTGNVHVGWTQNAGYVESEVQTVHTAVWAADASTYGAETRAAGHLGGKQDMARYADASRVAAAAHAEEYSGQWHASSGEACLLRVATNPTTPVHMHLPPLTSAMSLGGGTAPSEPVVVESDPPTVVSITTNVRDGTYAPGEVIPVNVTFSLPVHVPDVTTGIAPPTLMMGTSGGANRAALYHNGTHSKSLVFLYTVQFGDAASDLDVLGAGALCCGVSILRSATKPVLSASLAVPAPGSEGSIGWQKNITIYDDAAVVLTVDSTIADDTYSVGEEINITVRFSKPVVVTGKAAEMERTLGSAAPVPGVENWAPYTAYSPYPTTVAYTAYHANLTRNITNHTNHTNGTHNWSEPTLHPEQNGHWNAYTAYRHVVEMHPFTAYAQYTPYPRLLLNISMLEPRKPPVHTTTCEAMGLGVRGSPGVMTWTVNRTFVPSSDGSAYAWSRAPDTQQVWQPGFPFKAALPHVRCAFEQRPNTLSIASSGLPDHAVASFPLDAYGGTTGRADKKVDCVHAIRPQQWQWDIPSNPLAAVRPKGRRQWNTHAGQYGNPLTGLGVGNRNFSSTADAARAAEQASKNARNEAPGREQHLLTEEELQAAADAALFPVPISVDPNALPAVVGFALNGVPFYSPFATTRNAQVDGWTPFSTAGTMDVVAAGAGKSTRDYVVHDLCGGRPDDTGSYHYHSSPLCGGGPVPPSAGQTFKTSENPAATPMSWLGPAEGAAQTAADRAAKRHSPKIGYAMDGYAIYGPLGDGGEAPADLDQCNGREHPTLGYVYHVTPGKFPYVVGCFHGQVCSENECPGHPVYPEQQTVLVAAPATYRSGSGSDTLTFTYIPEPGHGTEDLGYVNTTSLVIGDESYINDVDGIQACLNLPPPAGKIDAPVIPPPVGWIGPGGQVGFYPRPASVHSARTLPTAASMDLWNEKVNPLQHHARGRVASVAPSAALALQLAEERRTVLRSSLSFNRAVVIDTTPPVVLKVDSVRPHDTYETTREVGAGSMVRIFITWNSPVVVTGFPLLALETGEVDRAAVYHGGSGTKVLEFRYVVQPGDNSTDLDYKRMCAEHENDPVRWDCIATGNTTQGKEPSDGLYPSALHYPADGSPGAAADPATSSYAFAEPLRARRSFRPTAACSIVRLSSNSSVPANLSLPVAAVLDGETPRGCEAMNLNRADPRCYRGATAHGPHAALNNTAGSNVESGEPDMSGGSQWSSKQGSLGFHSDVVVDTSAPKVVGLSSSKHSGIYVAGQVIEVQVKFNKPVRVMGTPRLRLTSNTTGARESELKNGTNSSALTAGHAYAFFNQSWSEGTVVTFVYTVRPEDHTADLTHASANALELSGGWIRREADHPTTDAVLVLPQPHGALHYYEKGRFRKQPSTRLGGQLAVVEKVEVTLRKLYHEHAEDLSIELLHAGRSATIFNGSAGARTLGVPRAHLPLSEGTTTGDGFDYHFVDIAGANLARAGTATQSSTAFGGGAERAHDGSTDGRFSQGSVTHSGWQRHTALDKDGYPYDADAEQGGSMGELEPWWQLKLAVDDTTPIGTVKVWNRAQEQHFPEIQTIQTTTMTYVNDSMNGYAAGLAGLMIGSCASVVGGGSYAGGLRNNDPLTALEKTQGFADGSDTQPANTTDCGDDTFVLTVPWGGLAGVPMNTAKIHYSAVAMIKDELPHGTTTVAGQRHGESMQAKLQALPHVGFVDVTRSPPDARGGYIWHVTFSAAPGDHAPMAVAENNIAVPGARVIVTTVQDGNDNKFYNYAHSIDTLTRLAPPDCRELGSACSASWVMVLPDNFTAVANADSLAVAQKHAIWKARIVTDEREQSWTLPPGAGAGARFVRVQREGRGYLSLAEVQVYERRNRPLSLYTGGSPVAAASFPGGLPFAPENEFNDVFQGVRTHTQPHAHTHAPRTRARARARTLNVFSDPPSNAPGLPPPLPSPR
jgi:hypothetical protein